MLSPLPCLAVGAATNGVARRYSVSMFSDSSASPGIEAARFATLPGRLHTSDSSPDCGTALQTHASVEYLRTHAGLGQDCSRQAVPNTTSCHNERQSSATA